MVRKLFVFVFGFMFLAVSATAVFAADEKAKAPQKKGFLGGLFGGKSDKKAVEKKQAETPAAPKIEKEDFPEPVVETIPAEPEPQGVTPVKTAPTAHPVEIPDVNAAPIVPDLPELPDVPKVAPVVNPPEPVVIVPPAIPPTGEKPAAPPAPKKPAVKQEGLKGKK